MLGIYGKDLTLDFNLAKLLEEILSVTSKVRIRLSSIEIIELSDYLLDVLNHDRICRHLHIPLQSADDTILARMNRSYTMKEYSLILIKIIRQFSNISIGTDIIVGFPTEEESHFNNTMSFLDSQPFTYLHVFPFSPRPGTVAANMKPQVSDLLRKERVVVARKLSLRKKATFLKANIGLNHEIIVETVNKTGIIGTTSNYIKVLAPMDEAMTPGRLVRIRITDVDNDKASGLPVNSVQPPHK